MNSRLKKSLHQVDLGWFAVLTVVILWAVIFVAGGGLGGDSFPNKFNLAAFLIIGVFSIIVVLLGILAQYLRRSSALSGRLQDDMLEYITDAYLEVDIEWRIIGCNKRARKLLEQGDTDCSAINLWDRYPEFSSFFYTPLTQSMSRATPASVKGYYPPSCAWLDIYPHRNEESLSLFIRDITVEHTLDLENRRMGAIIDNLHDGVVVIDRNSVIKVFNKAAEELFGYLRDEVVGKNISVLMPGKMHDVHMNYMHKLMLTGQSKVLNSGQREVIGKRKDGTIFPLDLGVSEQHVGDELLFVGIVRDITERKQTIDALKHASNYDELTGLPNRNLLNVRMLEAVERAKRTHKQVAVMFLDLDRFKTTNDTLGHAAGDNLLKQVAQRLKHSVRNSDTVARWGGDEFVVVLEGLTSANESSRVAEVISEALNKPFKIQDQDVFTGCSIGISIHPQDGNDIETLQKAADEAMYRVKNKGRGDFLYYAMK